MFGFGFLGGRLVRGFRVFVKGFMGPPGSDRT